MAAADGLRSHRNAEEIPAVGPPSFFDKRIPDTAFSLCIMAGAHHFDCVVLGGGSGGIAFARRAASYGAKVALVEYRRLGGTCVNVGCVPKKIMWCAANAFESLHGLKHLGVDFNEPPRFNWERLVENRENYISRLNKIYETNLEKSQVQRFYGWASLLPKVEAKEEHVIVVNETKQDSEAGVPPTSRLTAKHVLVATDSDGFFALKSQPKRVGVIGAGYIAVELCGVLQGLGTETHLFTRYARALRKFDKMIQNENHKNMQRMGVQLHPNSTPCAVRGSPGSLHLDLAGGESHGPFDCLINAIGRTPETEHMGLEALGVEMTHGKYIVSDEFQNTNVPGLFALGDCCGKVELTPMAIAAGRRLADRLYGQMPNAKADYDFVPSVVFAHPPIASVGLTEEEAIQQHGEDDIQSEQGRILGLHLVGLGADEILQGFAVAIKMGARKCDLDRCVAIHPTAAEEIVTLPPWGL
ncbi:putative glutathione reductase [Cyclospora cayetanensis]|uniref:Glutathione reductase n=1 Tax=Cyclospora cayetanensis TaxID=88456 RepID=A0A1D3D9G0_9EIME|nr:putative glutathione reductase [Cyclospora cayetanensis]